MHTLMFPNALDPAHGSRALREGAPGIVALSLSLVGGLAALLPSLIALLFQALTGAGRS